MRCAQRLGALDARDRSLRAHRSATSDGPLLAAAADDNKDQTYMLAAVEPRLIERLEFPLGLITKPEVRDRARAAGLAVADKPESQDLCFLAGIGRDGFLERHAGRADEPGTDPRSQTVMSSVAIAGPTASRSVSDAGSALPRREPLYVLDVDPSDNAVTVGPIDELQTTSVRLIGVRLLRDGEQVDRVKLRYRNTPTALHAWSAIAAAGRHRELRVELDESSRSAQHPARSPV